MSSFAVMPGHLIRRVHQVSQAIFADECSGHDLTSVQFAALSALRDHAGLDATRLAALIAFDRSTIGDVVERLEGKGLLRRFADPDDRRVKRLELTRAGQVTLSRVADAVARVQTRLLAPLEPDDRARLVRLLGTLIEAHRAAPVPIPVATAHRREHEG